MLVYQLEGSRLLVLLVLVLVVVSSDSAEHGAFEAWEANAASAEDEAERSARAESPARRTKRTASGRTLRWGRTGNGNWRKDVIFRVWPLTQFYNLQQGAFVLCVWAANTQCLYSSIQVKIIVFNLEFCLCLAQTTTTPLKKSSQIYPANLCQCKRILQLFVSKASRPFYHCIPHAKLINGTIFRQWPLISVQTFKDKRQVNKNYRQKITDWTIFCRESHHY